MERRRNEKRTGGRVPLERGGGVRVEDEEDYGDYVTRCICEFKHDDGYMICCDECSVWQHVECMQVDPKNLPENYLCELCEPRPVDKRRAQKIQLKKREDISDAEEKRNRRAGQASLPQTPLSTPGGEAKKPSSLLSSSASSTPAPPGGSMSAKKRKKKGKVAMETKMGDGVRKSKRERLDSSSAGGGSQKKQRRRLPGKGVGHMGSSSSIQSLLTAASLLEDENEPGAGHVGGKVTPMRRKSDLWNGERSPWTNKYETAEQNLYTEPVRAFLVSRMEQLKSEEVVYSREEYLTTMAHHHPQCVLAEVAHKRKGVLAQEGVPEDELVMECKGKIAVKQDILSDLVTGSRTSSLWKHKPCPFVYLYDKIANLDLCIDARNYGNLTRFIRRSCCPNAEVRHFFVSSELHFGVYALNHISPDEEVTLPFDFRYDKCDYPVECACGQSQSVCLVAQGKHPAAAGYRGGGVATEEDLHSSRNQGSTLQRSHSHVFLPQDEDSNSSWTSTGSVSRKKARVTGPVLYKPLGSCEPSRDVSSDSEEEVEKQRRKSLSREERKTEQVWRVFEKMEASAQRKRQQLLSEGSHDSDPLSSPTPLHPLSSRVLKDRHLSSSSSSRKAQLLPVGKMRLSSVSSTDPLSPYDPCEPFSPPITPAHLPTMDLRSPPLLSPSSPMPHYPAAPQLHPKYLFTDCCLPWKKAILRQWESEQLEGHTPAPRSYSVENHAPKNGVPTETVRPRFFGSLKHRWLEQHSTKESSPEPVHVISQVDHVAGNTSGSDKENMDSSSIKLPYKKQVLLRWQGTHPSRVPSPPPSPLTPPPLFPPPLASTAATSEASQPPDQKPVSAPGCVASGRGSPLFEEFSDSDDFMDHHSTALPDHAHHKDSGDPFSKQASPISPGPMSPPSSDHTPSSDVGGASPAVRDVGKGGGPPREPADDSGSHDLEEGNLSGVSDISSGSMNREPISPEPSGFTGPKTPPPLSGETTPSSGPAGVSDISSDNVESHSADVSIGETSMDAEGGATPLETVSPDNRGVASPEEGCVASRGSPEEESGIGEERDEGEGPYVKIPPPPLMSIFPSEELEGVRRPPPLESLMAGGVVAPPSPPSAQGTPSKTPGKRKITYNEYRSRARKPAEKKSSDRMSYPSSPPPPTTPGTPSFLTHSFFTSSLSSAYPPTLQLTSAPPLSTSPNPGAGETHFEPVSPEDGDRTPKLLGSHDDIVGSAVSALPPSSIMPLGGVVTPLSYSIPPGSALYSSYPTLQQAPPSSVPGYTGDVGRWIPADQAQDPRNRLPGSVSGPGGMVASSVGGMTLIQAPPLSGGGVPMTIMQQSPQTGLLMPATIPQGGRGVPMVQSPGGVTMAMMPQAIQQQPGVYPVQGGYYQVPPQGQGHPTSFAPRGQAPPQVQPNYPGPPRQPPPPGTQGHPGYAPRHQPLPPPPPGGANYY